MKIEAFVYGVPKGQPRPRAFSRGGKASVYDPSTAEGWKAQIALEFRGKLPVTPTVHPVFVDLEFYLPRPARLTRKKDPVGPIPHTAKPDSDNLAKAVLDALTSIGIWKDDSQVCQLHVKKYYTSLTWKPGAFISIQEIKE